MTTVRNLQNSKVLDISNRGVVTVTTTEKTYDNGNVRTFKKYTGPKGAVTRAIEWDECTPDKRKFGSCKNDKINTNRIEEDVFLELTQNIKATEEEWVPNGLLVEHARQLKWSDDKISELIQSDRPDKIMYSYYKNKQSISTTSDGKVKTKMGLRSRLRNNIQKSMQKETTETKPSFKIKFNTKMAGDRAANNEKNCTIYVNNVPTNVIEEDIQSLFIDKKYTIRRVNVVRKEIWPGGPKEPNGTAFIVCSTAEETMECIKFLDGARWDNSILSAKLSEPRA